MIAHPLSSCADLAALLLLLRRLLGSRLFHLLHGSSDPPFQTFRSDLPANRRQLTKKGGGDRSTPPFPRGAYFFFFVAFLAAFFFAGIRQIPPFGPGMDKSPPSVNMSRDKGIDILGIG